MIDLEDFIDATQLPKISETSADKGLVGNKKNPNSKINSQTKLLDLAHIKITKIDPHVKEEIESLITQSEQDLARLWQLAKKL